jgi:hypothetical protein
MAVSRSQSPETTYVWLKFGDVACSAGAAAIKSTLGCSIKSSVTSGHSSGRVLAD